jgi:hypothetical protein
MKALERMFGPPPPGPTECPDCGSPSIVPIRYGLPGPEMQGQARRGEILLGGCCVEDPRWHCKHCFCTWPEDPGLEMAVNAAQWGQAYADDVAREYASLAADVALPPRKDEPAVEKCWRRTDGRTIFLLGFAFGRVRLEKRIDLVSLGGTPEYRVIGCASNTADCPEVVKHQAALAALRHERDHPA